MEGSIPPTAYNVVKDQEFRGEVKVGLTFTPEVILCFALSVTLFPLSITLFSCHFLVSLKKTQQLTLPHENDYSGISLYLFFILLYLTHLRSSFFVHRPHVFKYSFQMTMAENLYLCSYFKIMVTRSPRGGFLMSHICPFSTFKLHMIG